MLLWLWLVIAVWHLAHINYTQLVRLGISMASIVCEGSMSCAPAGKSSTVLFLGESMCFTSVSLEFQRGLLWSVIPARVTVIAGLCPCAFKRSRRGHQRLASARNAAVSNAMFISWAGWIEMFSCGLGFWGWPCCLCIFSLHTWDLHICKFTLKYWPLLVPQFILHEIQLLSLLLNVLLLLPLHVFSLSVSAFIVLYSLWLSWLAPKRLPPLYTETRPWLPWQQNGGGKASVGLSLSMLDIYYIFHKMYAFISSITAMAQGTRRVYASI